jgi:hypothetical protein
MERKIIFIVFLVFFLMITGCGGDSSSSASSSKGGSVVSADYSPAQPTSSDAITLKITAVAGKTPDYNWIVNGVSVKNKNNNKLEPNHFSKNDTVFCSISIDGKEKKKVGPIIIKNSPPRINSLFIVPDKPVYGTDLSVSADVTDIDEDNIELRVKWFINDKEVSTNEILSGLEIKAADQVYAMVTPFDGTTEGPRVNSGWVLVQNSPPEIITAPPSIEGRTMNYEIKVKDGDGDKISLSLEQGPTGMRLEENRLVWEAPELKKDTSFMVKLKARDERGGETINSFSLDLKATEMR